MDYKQQSNQGCLVVDLMYLFGVDLTRQKEQRILSDGLFRIRENYTLGCLSAFQDLYPETHAMLYVDNKYYLDTISNWTLHPNLTLAHQKNNQVLLDSLHPPFIVYVDNHITNGWTHLPHFIMVTKRTEKFYEVYDPWEGAMSKVAKTRLINGIDSLRNHIKICPFVIAAT